MAADTDDDKHSECPECEQFTKESYDLLGEAGDKIGHKRKCFICKTIEGVSLRFFLKIPNLDTEENIDNRRMVMMQHVVTTLLEAKKLNWDYQYIDPICERCSILQEKIDQQVSSTIKGEYILYLSSKE